MPSHNSRIQHRPARCIERIHSNSAIGNREIAQLPVLSLTPKQRTAEIGFGGARIATFSSVLLLKIPPAISIFQKRHQPTRSKPLLSRQQHHLRDNDREQIVRARQAAEALFTSKSPVSKPTVTESAAPSPTGRKPRVLQIIAGPTKSDEDVKAAVTSEPQPRPQIPRSQFSRIRSWVKYGMTVRQVAEHYGAEIDEIRRIIRSS